MNRYRLLYPYENSCEISANSIAEAKELASKKYDIRIENFFFVIKIKETNNGTITIPSIT